MAAWVGAWAGAWALGVGKGVGKHVGGGGGMVNRGVGGGEGGVVAGETVVGGSILRACACLKRCNFLHVEVLETSPHSQAQMPSPSQILTQRADQSSLAEVQLRAC